MKIMDACYVAKQHKDSLVPEMQEAIDAMLYYVHHTHETKPQSEALMRWIDRFNTVTKEKEDLEMRLRIAQDKRVFDEVFDTIFNERKS